MHPPTTCQRSALRPTTRDAATKQDDQRNGREQISEEQQRGDRWAEQLPRRILLIDEMIGTAHGRDRNRQHRNL